MFTGIVEACGEVAAVTKSEDAARLQIRYEPQGRLQATLQPGESIAVNGVCLTATNASVGAFAADLSGTTLERTTLQHVSSGMPVNLENALRLGDPLGGHWVSGHIDGIGTIAAMDEQEGDTRLQIRAPTDLMRYLLPRGSVCVDGASLTVVDVGEQGFGVTLVPHTREQTIASTYELGQKVNLEIDMLARYIERLLEEREAP